jgi:hypothetical protein
MTFSALLRLGSFYLSVVAITKSPHTADGFTLSGPISIHNGNSHSTTSLFLFGRKAAKKNKEVESTTTIITSPETSKVQLKIVPTASAGVMKKKPPSTRELDKIFDTITFVPMGVTPPKVVSSSSLITEAEVLAAHKAWGEGLVTIAKAYEDRGYEEAKKVAKGILDVAYGYAKGIPVLFKPTLASGKQTFRTTEEGALSYFVGGNAKYPNDSGFAIKGWRRVESYPVGIILLGTTALSTGNVHCIDKDGKCTIVDKTWGYEKDNEGNVRIILHHSSLPYKKD